MTEKTCQYCGHSLEKGFCWLVCKVTGNVTDFEASCDKWASPQQVNEVLERLTNGLVDQFNKSGVEVKRIC